LVFTTGSTSTAGTGASLLEVRSNTRCLLHVPGLGHPERPERLVTVLDALEPPADGGWVVRSDSPLPPEDDTLGVLKWVHTPDYIDRVREASASGSGWLDSQDCAVSEGTFSAAVAAAGLALQASLDMANQRLWRAFVAIRPPSHHAERDRARGFCFFNSVALAAEVLVRAWNRPVLIVDIDALHGNGTQQHFWRRGDVAYLSVHRWPGFPETGAADEIGEDEGLGLTRNIPLAVASDDEVVCAALEHTLDEVAPVVQPAAIVVSAGFSGFTGDPVGELAMTEAGFRRMTSALVAAADRWSDGRMLSILEGGFAPEGLAEGARVHVEELAGIGAPGTDAGMQVN
jgi:acetoin utilization deacetylase AcuC-like enzyme